jgi:hypothetical protein
MEPITPQQAEFMSFLDTVKQASFSNLEGLMNKILTEYTKEVLRDRDKVDYKLWANMFHALLFHTSGRMYEVREHIKALADYVAVEEDK